MVDRKERGAVAPSQATTITAAAKTDDQVFM
jgi:hypothetical protein